MMRTGAALILINILLLCRGMLLCAPGPDDPLTISFDKTPLRQVLEELQQKAGVSFVYADELVDKVTVSCSLKNAGIEEALEHILNNTGISCKKSGRGQFILYPSESAPSFSVYGKVVDGRTGEALPYAGIMLASGRGGATANSEGWFTLGGIPFRSFTISVHHLGYLSRTVAVNAEALRGSLLIELEENALPTATVVVGEIRKDIISLGGPSGRLTIAAQNLPGLPVIGDKDISHSLQLVPGITPGNYGASGLHIRGGLPSHNLILLDGITLYHTEHSFGFLNAFNPGAIKDVRLYKGVFPSKFGDRLSGVMELTSRAGDFTNFRLNSGSNQLCAQATAEVPLWGKGAVLLSARRSISEYILGQLYDRVFSNIINNIVPAGPINSAASAPVSYENKTRDIYFYDLLGKATIVPGRNDVITYTWFSSLDNIQNEQKGESRSSASSYTEISSIGSGGSFKWGSSGQSLRWYRQWNSSFNSSFLLSASGYFVEDDKKSYKYHSREYQKISGDTVKSSKTISNIYSKNEDQRVLNDIDELTLKNDYSLNIQGGHSLDFGFSYVYNGTSFRNEEWVNDKNLDNQVKNTDTLSSNVIHSLNELNEDGRLISLYVQDSWTPVPALNIEAGMRALYFSLTGKPEFEPRLSVTYELVKDVTLKAAWGSHHQYILQCGDDFQNWYESRSWLLADGKTIKPASAVHTVAGLKYETADILFDAEVFIKSMKNVIERENRSASLIAIKTGNTAPAGFLQHDEDVSGVDLLLQKKTGRLSGWISSSFSRAEALYGKEKSVSLQDVPYSLNVVANYLLGRWMFSATWQYAAGKPVPVPDLMNNLKYYYISFNPARRNFERLPANHNLNVSITGNFNISGAGLKAGVSVFNLYDQKNIWYRYYTIKNNALSPVDIQMLGITPHVLCRAAALERIKIVVPVVSKYPSRLVGSRIFEECVSSEVYVFRFVSDPVGGRIFVECI